MLDTDLIGDEPRVVLKLSAPFWISYLNVKFLKVITERLPLVMFFLGQPFCKWLWLTLQHPLATALKDNQYPYT